MRPIIEPILPPVTISIAITSVYRTMALWILVIVVSRSSATVAIETFMTELSSAIRNCPVAVVSSTAPAAVARAVPSGLSSAQFRSQTWSVARRHARDVCPQAHHATRMKL